MGIRNVRTYGDARVRCRDDSNCLFATNMFIGTHAPATRSASFSAAQARYAQTELCEMHKAVLTSTQALFISASAVHAGYAAPAAVAAGL